MIKSLLIAIGGIVSLMLVWVAVLLAENLFRGYTTDEDVLAGRRSCGNCGCTTACKNKENEFSAN
ncbi:MAG: hypothetical protein IPM82_06900 [Saprospiraceae bacterium]|nr:hypothetical protein [Saprospiraceae bacterium]